MLVVPVPVSKRSGLINGRRIARISRCIFIYLPQRVQHSCASQTFRALLLRRLEVSAIDRSFGAWPARTTAIAFDLALATTVTCSSEYLLCCPCVLVYIARRGSRGLLVVSHLFPRAGDCIVFCCAEGVGLPCLQPCHRTMSCARL